MKKEEKWATGKQIGDMRNVRKILAEKRSLLRPRSERKGDIKWTWKTLRQGINYDQQPSLSMRTFGLICVPLLKFQEFDH
jgi:hypothetical protein